MAIDLTGIANENEFYTHHYLSAILEGDLREVLSDWRRRESEESGYRPPYAVLRTLARPFLEMRARLERERDPSRRLSHQRDFLAQLLPALGYAYRPTLQPLDDEQPLALLGAVARPDGAPALWIVEALDPSGEATDPLALTPHPAQFAPPTRSQAPPGNV
ncbi:MAG: hypothetical protein GVY09_09870, partial [Gammaproteobacteria bacterium]|nr:hypothetical protein [Gammaproteobacteria bacterium]